MKAGLVVYHRNGTSLSGQWTHEAIAGAWAVETVEDVSPGALIGTWPVKTFAPDGRLLFSGCLNSIRFGNCLKLTWQGILADGNEPARYEGVGL